VVVEDEINVKEEERKSFHCRKMFEWEWNWFEKGKVKFCN